MSLVLYKNLFMHHSDVLALIISPFLKWFIEAITYLPLTSKLSLEQNKFTDECNSNN